MCRAGRWRRLSGRWSRWRLPRGAGKARGQSRFSSVRGCARTLERVVQLARRRSLYIELVGDLVELWLGEGLDLLLEMELHGGGGGWWYCRSEVQAGSMRGRPWGVVIATRVGPRGEMGVGLIRGLTGGGRGFKATSFDRSRRGAPWATALLRLLLLLITYESLVPCCPSTSLGPLRAQCHTS